MFLPESVATHGREDVEPQWERISVQWEPWCRKKRKRTTQVIKPPLFAIKQPCLPCKFSVAKKVISRGNHGVLSSKKQVVGSWALFHNHVRSGKLRGFCVQLRRHPCRDHAPTRQVGDTYVLCMLHLAFFLCFFPPRKPRTL